MKHLISFLLAFLSLGEINALPDKSEADSAYYNKNFAEAAAIYHAIADSVPSADVYYNLGNAEYRLKHFGQSVLAYERALHEDPSHADAKFNLALVRSRLADRFSQPSEMFFISWLRHWISNYSVQHWVGMSFLCAFFLLLFLILYIIGEQLWVRKAGFFASILCGLLVFLFTSFALVQRHRYYHNNDAVILDAEVQLYVSPSTRSKELRVIHEGTTVTITDSLEKKWMQVKLPDATEGWIKNEGFQSVIK